MIHSTSRAALMGEQQHWGAQEIAAPQPGVAATKVCVAFAPLLKAVPQFPPPGKGARLPFAQKGKMKINQCTGCKELCSCKTQYKHQLFVRGRDASPALFHPYPELGDSFGFWPSPPCCWAGNPTPAAALCLLTVPQFPHPHLPAVPCRAVKELPFLKHFEVLWGRHQRCVLLPAWGSVPKAPAGCQSSVAPPGHVDPCIGHLGNFLLFPSV